MVVFYMHLYLFNETHWKQMNWDMRYIEVNKCLCYADALIIMLLYF